MIDCDLAAENHIIQADGRLGVEMLALPLVEPGWRDVDLDIEITDMMVGGFIPLARELDVCARLDGCRDLHFQRLLDLLQSAVRQDLAVLGVDLAASLAFRACALALHDAERRLHLLGDLAVALTGLARLGLCAGDFLEPGICYFFGYAGIGFLETDVDGDLDILAALDGLSPASSAESASEDAAHEVPDIEISEIESLASESALASETSEIASVESAESSFPEGIVLRSFLVIADDLIRLVDLLEFLLVASPVRMMLDGSFFECLLDILC